jgi:fucose permease
MRSTTFLPTSKFNSLIQQQQQSNRIAEVAEVEKELMNQEAIRRARKSYHMVAAVLLLFTYVGKLP